LPTAPSTYKLGKLVACKPGQSESLAVTSGPRHGAKQAAGEAAQIAAQPQGRSAVGVEPLADEARRVHVDRGGVDGFASSDKVLISSLAHWLIGTLPCPIDMLKMSLEHGRSIHNAEVTCAPIGSFVIW